MTRREEKQRVKRIQYQEAEMARLKRKKTRRMSMHIVRAVSIVFCVGFLCGGLLLSDKPQLLCFLGCFWMWGIVSFVNWRMNPSGTSVSLRQVGKSGLLKPVQNKNSTVFFVSLAIAIVLSIIIIPL